MDLYVRVNDGSPDDQDALVVELTVPISLNPASDNSQPVTIYQNPSGQGQFLRLAFQLTCAENFYSEDCSRFCLGRDDEGGHYSCDETGAIICLEGFEGDNCMQCILAPECCKSDLHVQKEYDVYLVLSSFNRAGPWEGNSLWGGPTL